MSWTTGSAIASELINTAMVTFPAPKARTEYYKSLIEIFTDFDCDTLDECLGVDEAFDEAYEEVYGPSDEDEYDDE